MASKWIADGWVADYKNLVMVTVAESILTRLRIIEFGLWDKYSVMHNYNFHVQTQIDREK